MTTEKFIIPTSEITAIEKAFKEGSIGAVEKKILENLALRETEVDLDKNYATTYDGKVYSFWGDDLKTIAKIENIKLKEVVG
jgi:hypothetical protein